MYKKFFLPFLLCILTVPMLAQGQIRQAAQAGIAFSPRQVSRVLSRRVKRTFESSLPSTNLFPQAMRFVGIPVDRIQNLSNLTPQDLYPEVSFLTTNKQAGNYLLARNNRSVPSLLAAEKQRFEEIQQHFNEFKKGVKSVLEGEEINWIVSQIPDKTSCLFLGEHHSEGYNIQDSRIAIADVLTALRARYPQRPMVLFTEFLPEGEILGNTISQFDPNVLLFVSQAAQNATIPLIGLEPDFVWNNRNSTAGVRGTKFQIPTWALAEGVLLRNKRWSTLMSNLRHRFNENPELQDALFIVFAGNGHTEYGMAHSLTAMLPDEKIFSVSFYPTYLTNKQGECDYVTSHFDVMTQGFFAEEKTLLFKDPQLAQLAGFNIRYKTEPRHAMDVYITETK